MMLASLPLAVDLPAASDSSRAGRLTVEAAGGHGQFAFVSRGCDGSIYRVTHHQLQSGALVVEQRLPQDFVIGVRAGSVRTTLHPVEFRSTGAPGYMVRETTLTQRFSNPYVNPYAGYEGRRIGLGVGALMADRPFITGENSSERMRATGHVRLGSEESRLVLRWMEDVPLESEGHFSADFGVHPPGRIEAGAFLGLFGPYDGAMLGMRGRVWVTPDAALQIKASTTTANREYGVYGSVTARLPGMR
jgi:hypothetical protein